MIEIDNPVLVSDFRTAVSRLIKKLRKKSVTSGTLSLTERSTISLLDQHQQLLPTELAAMEQITNQSMSQILNHLSELGYITRTPSATDGRKVFISLSDAGHGMLNKMRSERDEWLNKALAATCQPAEMEILRSAVTIINRVVEFE